MTFVLVFLLRLTYHCFSLSWIYAVHVWSDCLVLRWSCEAISSVVTISSCAMTHVEARWVDSCTKVWRFVASAVTRCETLLYHACWLIRRSRGRLNVKRHCRTGWTSQRVVFWHAGKRDWNISCRKIWDSITCLIHIKLWFSRFVEMTFSNLENKTTTKYTAVQYRCTLRRQSLQCSWTSSL